VRGALRLDLGILGFAIGIMIGIVSSRMFHISWNHDAEKVVSRFDRFGIIVLIFYILLKLSREKIINYFAQGFEVGTIGFAVLAGIMIGRSLGTRGKILQILKEQKIFK
jgi:Kef-type K+ transport system membrane component KefB